MAAPASRRWLVMIVAAPATTEAILQSFDASLDDRADKTVLWMAGAVAIFLIALVIEGFKSPGPE